MRGGEGQVPASAVDSRLRLLDSVTGFWEMKPDTALKNGYRLPFYVSAVRYTIRILAPCCIVLQIDLLEYNE